MILKVEGEEDLLYALDVEEMIDIVRGSALWA